MTRRDKVLSTIRSHQADLRQHGVRNLAVFGSVARDEATSESDVDILIEFDRSIGIFEFIRIKMKLEEWLSSRVDLATPDALHPALRDRILNEAIYV